MHTLRTVLLIGWAVFWLYWLLSAGTAKAGRGTRNGALARGLAIVGAFVALRVLGVNEAAVHSTALQIQGTALFACGLGVAVWARVFLGRNWGMPMTLKDEPELVTAGPYRHVRHPIYSGLLLAVLGTALATDLYWLVILAVMGAYFIYSARVEEGLMESSFPATYPRYRASTKMLIPFVL